MMNLVRERIEEQSTNNNSAFLIDLNKENLLASEVIVFIDSQVEEYQSLVNHLVPEVNVFVIDSQEDGVKAIAKILKSCDRVDEIHIVSHGFPGSLKLGNTELSLDTLDYYASYLKIWSNSLSDSSSILLYGCNVAAEDAGKEFLRRLYYSTKANIAASEKPTGSASLGGDWNLEIKIGNVSTKDIFSATVRENYSFVLGADDTEIDIWYGDNQKFGNIGIPQTWVNILGNVSDPDGLSSLTYSLNGDPVIPLTIGTDGRRLERDGDFNVDPAFADLDPSPIDDELVITATDSLGNITNKTIFIDYEAGNTWPQPYTIDWSSVTDIQDVAQVVDGKWAVEGDTVRTTEPGYDRLIAIGDISWDNYEATAQVTLNSTTGGSAGNGNGVGFIAGWTGHTDNPISGTQPKSGFLPFGALSWYADGQLEIRIGNGQTKGDPAKTLQDGVTYTFKLRTETQENGRVLYSFKVWETGQAEPTAWDVEREGNNSGVKQGSIGLVVHEYDATFGDVNIVPLSGSTSNQAPIANDDSATVAPSDTVEIDVLSNDSDSDGTLVPGSLAITTQPSNGNISIDSNGLVSYTHDGSATTSDSFSYTVDDDDGETSNIATVDLTIEEPAGNQAPVANDDTATVAPSDTVEIDVLSNDSDSDGTLVPGSLAITTQPSNGNISIDSNGLVSYTHDGSATTSDSFSYTVDDDDGETSNVATVDLAIAEPSGLVFESDDFNSAVLDSRWTVIDPLGDSFAGTTGVGTGDALLELSVPSGTPHNLFDNDKNAVRIMQSATDSDFEAEVKFASEPSQKYQGQGILIEQDNDDWIRFDTFHNGKRLQIFAATTTTGNSQTIFSRNVSGAANYLRVNRQGDEWALDYSADGSSWTTAGSFTHDLSVSQVGTFATNSGPSPAFTAEVDYFFNTIDPIVPEV